MCSRREGICIAGHEKQCRLSEFCKKDGKCLLGPTGYCIARDCLNREECKYEGRCFSYQGKCIFAAHGCSVMCEYQGDCALIDGVCKPRSAAHCRKSQACANEGRCLLGPGGECDRMTERYCRESDECKSVGQCTLLDKQCTAATRKDCSGSIACQRRGLCFADAGRCVARPEELFHSDGRLREVVQSALMEAPEITPPSPAACRLAWDAVLKGACGVRNAREARASADFLGQDILRGRLLACPVEDGLRAATHDHLRASSGVNCHGPGRLAVYFIAFLRFGHRPPAQEGFRAALMSDTTVSGGYFAVDYNPGLLPKLTYSVPANSNRQVIFDKATVSHDLKAARPRVSRPRIGKISASP